MTRRSKQERKRARCPRTIRLPGAKTGPRKEKSGYRKATNALAGTSFELQSFIPKAIA